MIRETDTLIIGGGAIGICCAHYLNELGKDVLVVEKNDICSGSSYGNAGLIVPSYCIPLAAPGVLFQGLKWMFQPRSPFYIKPRLNRQLIAWLWHFRRACTAAHVQRSIPVLHALHSASFKLFEELADLEGLDFGLQKRGMLELFKTRKGYEAGIRDAHLVENFGVKNRILEKSELGDYLGGLQTAAVGGAYLPHDAHLVPHRFVRQLAGHIEKKGGHLLTGCEVLDFKTSGRRIAGVTTTRGEILTQHIIIASGVWSANLAQRLRIDLPLQPAKGYSISFRRPAACPPLPLAMAEAKVVLTPMADELRLAGTLELAGYDDAVNMLRVQAILDTAREYLPDLDLDSPELIAIWRGWRPCSPDGLPYVGRSPRYDNAVVAAGHGMLGISLAPITGKIVSQLVAGQRAGLDITALSVERFN
jgi:D-amino-acid dehydrogenase